MSDLKDKLRFQFFEAYEYEDGSVDILIDKDVTLERLYEFIVSNSDLDRIVSMERMVFDLQQQNEGLKQKVLAGTLKTQQMLRMSLEMKDLKAENEMLKEKCRSLGSRLFKRDIYEYFKKLRRR